MPKTRDAFAFHDFDGERILQRKFFRKLNLPADTDNEILARIDKYIKHIARAIFENLNSPYTSVSTKRRLSDLQRLNEIVDLYKERIELHCEKIVSIRFKYGEKIIMGNYVTFDEKYRRTTELLEHYELVLNAICELIDKIQKNNEKATESYKKQWQKEFGDRLRDARLAKGLTQANLGIIIGMSQNAIQKYEAGTADISSRNLSEVAKILGVSADSLLGLK